MAEQDTHSEIMSALSNFGGRIGTLEGKFDAAKEKIDKIDGKVDDLIIFKSNIEGKISIITVVLGIVGATILGAIAFVSKWVWDKLVGK